MGVALPEFVQTWMSDGQRRAVSEPLALLRVALDNERWPAAIGAAKDLAEAACKVSIEHAGATVAASDTLPSPSKKARTAAAADATEADLGHRLVAVVDQLAQVRNVAGAGHGRADQREVTARERAPCGDCRRRDRGVPPRVGAGMPEFDLTQLREAVARAWSAKRRQEPVRRSSRLVADPLLTRVPTRAPSSTRDSPG
jgi:hypothetical protein